MVVTPEQFIIYHADVPYDPVKAHEYYLRTRELRGRRSGFIPSGTGRVASVRNLDQRPKIKTPEQQRKEIEVRVRALKVRLEKLRDVLKELVKQAKARSGVEIKDKEVSDKASAGSKKLTAAQKQEAAKRAKEYYDKNKKPSSLSDKEKQLQLSIKQVEEKIRKAREELKASIVRARQNSVQLKPAA